MICLAFKPRASGSLVGFADLEMPSGIILRDCTLHSAGSSRWVSPPGRPRLDADKKPELGPNGKLIYATVVDFTSKDVRDRWSRQCVDAIDQYLKSPQRESA